jgi:hypothetical protein
MRSNYSWALQQMMWQVTWSAETSMKLQLSRADLCMQGTMCCMSVHHRRLTLTCEVLNCRCLQRCLDTSLLTRAVVTGSMRGAISAVEQKRATSVARPGLHAAATRDSARRKPISANCAIPAVI